MENNKIKSEKEIQTDNTKKEDIKFKDFKSFIMAFDNFITGKSIQSGNHDINCINNLQNFDNTDPNMISEILSLQTTKKLLFNNFDVLPKEELSKFGIIKKFNNRETYFYFLEYIINLRIIDNKNKKVINKPSINIENKKEKKLKIPNLIIDFSEGKIDVKNNNVNITNNSTDEKTETNFEDMIKLKNISIDEYFKILDIISIKDLRKKIKEYKKLFVLEEEHKNNFPDFETELFYHYQLKNIFKSFKELDDDEINKKIDMYKELEDFIIKVKEKKIKDKIILSYFYLVIDVEYELELFIMLLMSNYDEQNIEYKNGYVNKKENKFYIYNSDIVIDNFDYYRLDQKKIEDIKNGEIDLPLNKYYYSLKGHILLREFTSEDGNLVYEKFIKGKIFDGLFPILFGEKGKEKIIKTKNLFISLLENNTYYFPIKNPTYAAYTDKYCFKIYVDFSINEVESFHDINLDDIFKHIIRKSFMTVNIIHEFGYCYKIIIFYINPEQNIFDSPLIKFKFPDEKEKETKEGGQIIEYLLFGRIINKMNIKEIIYIYNLNNFSKTLEEYRNDFINLKNESVNEVFKRESQKNPEILTLFEIYKKLPKETKIQLEKKNFKSAKRYDDESSLNFEEFYFESSKDRNKPHNRDREDSDSD